MKPTPKYEYDLFQMSNNCLDASKNQELIDHTRVLSILNSSPQKKEILGRKKIRLEDLLNSSLIYEERHHYGKSFKWLYFYKHIDIAEALENNIVAKICKERLSNEAYRAEQELKKSNHIAFFKNFSFKVGDYRKNGRRFEYFEKEYQNKYVEITQYTNLKMINNDGSFSYFDLSRKNTSVLDDGKKITKTTFNRNVKIKKEYYEERKKMEVIEREERLEKQCELDEKFELEKKEKQNLWKSKIEGNELLSAFFSNEKHPAPFEVAELKNKSNFSWRELREMFK